MFAILAGRVEGRLGMQWFRRRFLGRRCVVEAGPVSRAGRHERSYFGDQFSLLIIVARSREALLVRYKEQELSKRLTRVSRSCSGFDSPSSIMVLVVVVRSAG